MSNTYIQIGSKSSIEVILLTVTFFVAKVAGYIAWSWWLVFAPLWMPVAFILSIPIVAITAYALYKMSVKIWSKFEA